MRPLRSGRSTSTWRSKRPARSSAGSRISGRLVAARMIRPTRRVEAVHLDQQLVQRLLLLVVAAQAGKGAARAAQRVELVDEDDGRRLGARLLEQVAHPRRAHADEHLDELAARDGEERHAGLARHRPGQQRLAGAGRADQQHALGHVRAQPAVLLRVLEEIDDLFKFVPWPRRRRPRRQR